MGSDSESDSDSGDEVQVKRTASSDDEVQRSDDEVQRSDDEVQRSEVEDNEDEDDRESIKSPPISRSPSGSEGEQEVDRGSEDGDEVQRRRSSQEGSQEEDEEAGSPDREQRQGSPTSENSEDGSEAGARGETSQEDNDAAQTTAKDIFGSDMSSEDEDDQENVSRRRRDSSSQERSPRRKRSEDEEEEDEDERRVRDSHQAMREESYRNDMMEGEDGEERGEDGTGEEAPLPEVVISTQIPRLVADLGSEFHFVKFPNFLSVDTHPYDPSWYEDEIDEDEVLDEEGKGRLKLKVENTIRWRTATDPKTGEEVRESNARIVKWSDGTSSLYLGSEIFDIHTNEMIQGENNHLFVRQGVGLQGQAVFRTKLSFRPHSTDSFTHRKITLSLADKSQKTHKIRVLPNVGQDPEAHRSEMIKKEEDRLKASIRRENKIRRTRERAHSRGPSASYLEPDQYDDDDEDGISLSAIKNKFKRKEFASTTYSDSDDGSDLEIGRKSSDKKKQARIQESDDDD